MYDKGQKVEFLNLKYLFFLAEILGLPPPFLTENLSAQKSLADLGGIPMEWWDFSQGKRGKGRAHVLLDPAQIVWSKGGGGE